MISNPTPGQRVTLWYAEAKRRIAPLHGKPGVVFARAAGPGPRNHAVEVEGRLVIVPAGQLRKERGR